MRAADEVIAVRVLSVDETSGLYLLESQDEPAPDPGEVVWCMSADGQPSLPANGFVVQRFSDYRFAIMDLTSGGTMSE